MDPNLRALLNSPRVTPSTRRVLEERLNPPKSERRYLSESQFKFLVGVVDLLRPPYPHPTAEEIACEIDARLAQGTGDGWRYDGLAPDRHAIATMLDALCEPSEILVGDPRLREDLLAEVTEIAYAHPEVQFAIGYVGFADAQGWRMPDREDGQ